MSANTPLVSVIIPTHNRETVLPRALQSALGQTYRNLEIVVVDDASTDRTRELLRAIPDRRLRLLEHQERRGASAARNTGLRSCQGEYVSFLDSDDEWLPHKLETQITAMQEKNQKFCFCQFRILSGAGVWEIMPLAPYRGGSLLEYLVCDGGSLATPSLVVHHSIKVFFDETLPVAQDYDWVLQVFQSTQDLLFIPQPLFYVHRDVPQRISAHQEPLYEMAKPFTAKYWDEIEAHPRVKRALFRRYASDALSRNQRSLARSLLLRHWAFPSLSCKPKGFRLWKQAFLG
jgi:glycosyltransferase involved in cell wall biosynthesis